MAPLGVAREHARGGGLRRERAAACCDDVPQELRVHGDVWGDVEGVACEEAGPRARAPGGVGAGAGERVGELEAELLFVRGVFEEELVFRCVSRRQHIRPSVSVLV